MNARVRVHNVHSVQSTARNAAPTGIGLLVIVVAGLAAGCAGLQLKSNVREVRAIAREARDRGAYKCAPRELALAETHIEFASSELDQGDYFRARDHVRIADRNAREAYNLALRCAPKTPGDRDHDGILDNVDKCPDDPEDKDGFEDEDGCPDPDNDKDRILDKDDKCPNEPETYNGTDDEDGCPDRGRVVVTDTAIEILDMVYFEYNKAVIKSQSFPILDAVAATLQGNPSIALIEVQGHTDERGDDAYNLDLSDRRAHSVEKYLADKGVDPKRLTAQGYGETQPLDPRSTEAAWAKNRRVAFLILKRTSD